ncbi:glycerol dehydrogenase [Formicincola oecophyllae]|uniref:Glycerol dehydrogenase n=1 Tax=Formicincola oecophyllae TaxID=2558361 RepID=A0A4Y6U9B4_9PROT|nr:glycerol dehydrogenase [Formicincola oecophyllae]QDH13794.1 glycerol dehydrogenase [Formicincola oecophyllae]
MTASTPVVPRGIASPSKFIIGPGLLAQLPDVVKDFGTNAIIICDPFILPHVERESLPALAKAGLKGSVEKFNGECCDSEIKRLSALAKERGANVVVGVGGGKTLDTSKAVSHALKHPLVLYPTIASSDAPCIALAVVYTDEGAFSHYLHLPQNPSAVMADTSVIAGAPARFFSAGIGDALATYFEAQACYDSDGTNLLGKKPSRTGLGMARLCYDILRDNVDSAMDAISRNVVTDAVTTTVEATIYLSGVGSESGGLAAAHAIHDGMTVVEDIHHAQHGEKVIFGLMCQFVLANTPRETVDEVVRIALRAGLPLTLQQLGLKKFVPAEWRKVAELACSPDDTMGNMPMKITPDDVYNAIVTANVMGERHMAAAGKAVPKLD